MSDTVLGFYRWRRPAPLKPTSGILLVRLSPSCYRPADPTMATKSPLSKKEVGDLREHLVAERIQLKAQFDELEQSTFATNQSDLTGEMGFDEEYADAGSATFERERDLSLVNNLRDLMDRIDKALVRMDDGTYGLCGRCGKPIEKLRLKALPYANLCLKDKQAEERVR